MTELRSAPVDAPAGAPGRRSDLDSRSDLAPQLEPVRQALLRDAQGTVADILGTARADAAQIVARAQSSCDEAVEHARQRAVASAHAQSEQALADARREAHAVVLRAEGQLRRQLVNRVYDAAEGLRADPRYPALLDHLAALARAQLGQGALVTADPQPGGGVLASAGSRRVDYRLRALADLALDAVSEDITFGATTEETPWA